MSAEEIARKSMLIASDLWAADRALTLLAHELLCRCVFTNNNLTVETIDAVSDQLYWPAVVVVLYDVVVPQDVEKAEADEKK